MKLLARCPGCGVQIELTSSQFDKRCRCPHCGGLIKIPNAVELEKAIGIMKSAQSSVFVDETGRIYG